MFEDISERCAELQKADLVSKSTVGLLFRKDRMHPLEKDPVGPQDDIRRRGRDEFVY